MCGRYTLRARLNRLLDQFAAELAAGLEETTRYNISPGESQPPVTAVRLLDGRRQLTRLHWPFVPSSSPTRKLKINTVNAKAETVATSKAYGDSYRHRRCLILADAYVEWKKVGRGKSQDKLPYLYEIDGGNVFAMAGLWDAWRDPEKPTAPTYESCTLIVTEGNALTLPIHDRMPVIVPQESYDDWLACQEIPLLPFPAARMSVRRTSTYINNPAHEGPECLAPPQERELF